MKESDTYQAILEEGVERGRAQGREVGRVEEAIRALLIVGTARLGEADGAVRRRIEAETDLNRLEEWLRHVARVESWSELPGFLRAAVSATSSSVTRSACCRRHSLVPALRAGWSGKISLADAAGTDE